MTVSFVMNIAETECNVHGEVIPIGPGQVGVEVGEVGVQGAVFVVLDDEVGDGTVGVDGVSVEVDNLWACAAELVKKADLALDCCQVAKGLADLNIVLLPAPCVDGAEPTGDMSVKDEVGELFKGDQGCRLLEDLQDALVDRCHWYSHFLFYVYSGSVVLFGGVNIEKRTDE